MKEERAKAIMVLGTGSGVGKSFVAAGLCRLLRDAGIRVAPFKAQNMSNNSFVTSKGEEMARAQAVQAECARIEPSVQMNPVLLKPSADDRSQIILQGKVVGTMKAREYYNLRPTLWTAIQESYEQLSRGFEVLVIEGAGSPAEINLREYDMVNFRMAELADAQCLLVGDIDRGGVFAWLLGTLALLEEAERKRIVGVIINKFRGDRSLLEPGLGSLETLCGKKVLGVLPYESDLWIEEEDAVVFEQRSAVPERESLDIGVILLPRISNATDFQILGEERGVSVRMIRRIEEFGEPDLVVLPGTKSTLADLEYLKNKGFARKIRDYILRGGRILGVCGGFQMLGERIEDPDGVESGQRIQAGLSLLPLRTTFFPEKTLRRVRGRIQNEIFSERIEAEFSGYEIHMGQTETPKGVPPGLTARRAGGRPLFEICDGDYEGEWRPEGVVDSSGRVLGTYLHGLFDEAGFRAAFLDALWKSSGKKRTGRGPAAPSASVIKERNYNRLATLLKDHLDPGFLESWLNLSVRSY